MNVHLPALLTVHESVPAGTTASRLSTLGPFACPTVAPFGVLAASESEPQLNDSFACEFPAPLVTLKLRFAFLPLSVPVKVVVCVVDEAARPSSWSSPVARRSPLSL